MDGVNGNKFKMHSNALVIFNHSPHPHSRGRAGKSDRNVLGFCFHDVLAVAGKRGGFVLRQNSRDYSYTDVN